MLFFFNLHHYHGSTLIVAQLSSKYIQVQGVKIILHVV